MDYTNVENALTEFLHEQAALTETFVRKIRRMIKPEPDFPADPVVPILSKRFYRPRGLGAATFSHQKIEG